MKVMTGIVALFGAILISLAGTTAAAPTAAPGWPQAHSGGRIGGLKPGILAIMSKSAKLRPSVPGAAA